MSTQNSTEDARGKFMEELEQIKSSFSNQIKTLKSMFGWTNEGLGRMVGVTGEAVRKWSEGLSLPGGDNLYILSRITDLSLDWLLTGKEPPCVTSSEFTPIPKVKIPLSGGPGSWELDPQVEGYYEFRTKWLKSKGQPNYMKLMQVVGDSMAPTICDGDHVLVDESRKEPEDGKIMALVGRNNEALVKRIRIHLDGKILLVSDHEKTHDGPYDPEELTILGKVIWLGREL
jgi:SOS-response transcriptional repressor LexA